MSTQRHLSRRLSNIATPNLASFFSHPACVCMSVCIYIYMIPFCVYIHATYATTIISVNMLFCSIISSYEILLYLKFRRLVPSGS